jgi:hypothetical protein
MLLYTGNFTVNPFDIHTYQVIRELFTINNEFEKVQSRFGSYNKRSRHLYIRIFAYAFLVNQQQLIDFLNIFYLHNNLYNKQIYDCQSLIMNDTISIVWKANVVCD